MVIDEEGEVGRGWIVFSLIGHVKNIEFNIKYFEDLLLIKDY